MSEPAVQPPPAAVPPPDALCPSCGEPRAGTFCRNCGERLTDLRLPARLLLKELFSYLVRVDGKLLRTVWPLLVRPGFLTLEYLRGRRAPYERPLKLFLASTLLSFLAFSLSKPEMVSVFRDERPGSGSQIHLRVQVNEPVTPEQAKQLDQTFSKLAEPKPDDGLLVARLRKAFASGPKTLQQDLRDTWQRLGPKLALAFLPLHALVLLWLYRRRGLYYSEHFIFALHARSFWALTSLVGHLTSAGLVTALLRLLNFAYLFRASRVVYGLSRGSTFWRCAVLILVEGVFQVLTAAIVFGALLLRS